MSKEPIEILLDRIELVPVVAEPSDSGLPYPTHEGILRLGTLELRVYQLNTGQRVIEEGDFARFFGCETVDELKAMLRLID